VGVRTIQKSEVKNQKLKGKGKISKEMEKDIRKLTALCQKQKAIKTDY
jgi:hypothetical protein